MSIQLELIEKVSGGEYFHIDFKQRKKEIIDILL